jgi:hypothetical protein
LTTIRGSDGLDYENLTERLVGNPLPTYRNNALRAKHTSRAPKDEVRVWVQAYDRAYSKLFQESQGPGQATSIAALDWGACSEADSTFFAYRQERRLAERQAADLLAADLLAARVANF